MSEENRTSQSQGNQRQAPHRFDMEALIGSILLVGVLLSVMLIVAGLVWHLVKTGNLVLNFMIKGMNLYRFIIDDANQLQSGNITPGLFIDLGIAVLLLTPFVRVLASVIYFMIVERNWKFVVFTGFVCSVLVYSLFIR